MSTQYLEDFLDAPDGHEIPLRVWRPRHPEQVLVIAHGMAEYCERYAPLADYLTESNIAVVALNHRGHGMDCDLDELGYFADDHGWQRVIDDLDEVIKYARRTLPGLPVTLMGHSMGSFITQCYLQQHPTQIDQVILSASNRIDRPKLMSSLMLLAFIKFYKGKKATSALVDFLSLGVFNKKFRPNKTSVDWLSRNEASNQAYEEDPYCGFSCSLLMWQDFINGMLSIDIKRWSKNLPIHFLAGTDDPVGEFGKGSKKLVEQCRQAGVQVATTRWYEGARHELVNETNQTEVWADILAIVSNTKKAEAPSIG